MQSLSTLDILIGLVILGAVIAVLHAIATDIRHTHMRVDLARRVIDRRERYLRELKGDFEVAEVEIYEENNPVPVAEAAEIEVEAPAAAA